MSDRFATVLAMRFLHTSDWHLGRSLHRADLREAQAAFLDHLVETARSERVDAVLVAGDVYDRAIPPLDAVALYEDALARLRAAGARVILISGNHDSARRLGVNSALIDAAGVHLRTRPAALADPVLLDDDARPGRRLRHSLPGAGARPPRPGRPAWSQRDACRPGRSGGAGRGATQPCCVTLWALSGRMPPRAARTAPSSWRTPGWRTGGTTRSGRTAARRQASDSERDIAVGGIGYVPSALFDGFSYAALGHLHGRQTLADHLRYSGSPLPYSFSEKDHVKGSWLVEVGAAGQAGGPTAAQ